MKIKNILRIILPIIFFSIIIFILIPALFWIYVLLDSQFGLLASPAEGLIIMYFPIPFIIILHPFIIYFSLIISNKILKIKMKYKQLKVVTILSIISLLFLVITTGKIYILILFPRSDFFLITYLILILFNIIFILIRDFKNNKLITN